ncbi:glycosyltransferase [Candidatus Poribacteria bacterium]|nr:glycosyltransferase [Candidatus Poribacteria bacterium]
MNYRPMVSIITPSYNQGDFIEETILSIRGQTYKNFEHIVVDACSTDNTLDILKKYEGTYNLSWISEPDEGMYQAINKGLKKARGEILCYLNTDDLYLPWTLNAVATYFSQNKQVDLIYGDIIHLDDIKGTIELTFSPPFNLRWALIKGGLYQPAVFWSRRAYERVGGFDEQLQLCGDFEYWLRIATHVQVQKMNEFLAVDRNHLKRKIVVQSKAVEEEMSQVKENYGLPPAHKIGLRFIYRIYDYFWTRCYMVMFIAQYLRGTARRTIYWPAFLGSKDLNLTSVSSLLLRLVPYLGKSKWPWTIGNLPSSGAKYV